MAAASCSRESNPPYPANFATVAEREKGRLSQAYTGFRAWPMLVLERRVAEIMAIQIIVCGRNRAYAFRKWRIVQVARAKFLRLPKPNTGVRENLKTALGIFLIVGVIIGFVVVYGYSVLTQEQKSWHPVTSFILATANDDPEHFQVANTYPDLHYSRETDFPNFTVAESLWRVTVETLPYYNITVENVTSTVYYSGAYGDTIQIWKDRALTDTPFGSITLLDPRYQYNAPTGYASLFGVDFYTTYGDYVPVRTTQIFAGAGNYVVTLQMTLGCFNFTIEEYR
jgi:hypothetical protein